MTAESSTAASSSPRRRRHPWWWTLLLLLLLVGGWWGYRAWRFVRQARQFRAALRGAGQDSWVGGTKLGGFSAGFLQMAFGDVPELQQQVTAILADYQERQPELFADKVSMMLVTYRQDGGVHDVAIRLVGEPPPVTNDKTASGTEVHKRHLPPELYDARRSLTALLGSEVQVLAAPGDRTRQEQLMQAIKTGQQKPIVDYLQEPVNFVLVVPEPGQLFKSQFESYLLAVLIQGEVSLDGAHGKMVALGLDPTRAESFADFLSDSRILAGGLARIKFTGGPVELAVRSISRAKIEVQGATVSVSGDVPPELIEVGLPRLLKGLAKKYKPATATPADRPQE